MGNMQFGVDWETRVDFIRLREERLRKTHEAMRSHGLDALLLFKPPNIRYVASAKGVETPWDLSECCVAVVDKDPVVFLSPEIGLDAPWLASRLRAAPNLSGAGPGGDGPVQVFAHEVAAIIGA